jgi:hypothetical protein
VCSSVRSWQRVGVDRLSKSKESTAASISRGITGLSISAVMWFLHLSIEFHQFVLKPCKIGAAPTSQL